MDHFSGSELLTVLAGIGALMGLAVPLYLATCMIARAVIAQRRQRVELPPARVIP